MKKLTQIIATAFLALSLGYSAPVFAKSEFNLKPAEEITAETKISLRGNNFLPRDILKDEERYSERELERQFYGITSNGEAYIELMIFRDKEKKLGEENNYHYTVYWGDPSDGRFEGIKYKNYKIEDPSLIVTYNLEELKKELEEKNPFPSRFFWAKGRGRPFTLHEEDIRNKTTFYFGLNIINLKTWQSEDLVYTIKIVGKDEKGNPQFRGYSNGLINYQDTDNDPIPKIIIEKLKEEI